MISLLFNLLNKEKIPYLVLRNYESLPERPLEGSDIDLLIDREWEEKYFKVLKEAIQKSGGYLLLKSRQSNCLSCFLYQKKPFPLGFWVDAFWEISSKGFVWADSKFLLKNRIWNEKGFYTSPQGGEAATLFVRDALNASFIQERYRSKISSFAQKDKESFIKTIKPYFNEKIINEMLDICQNEKWEDVSKKRKKWWRNLLLNIHPFGFLNFLFFQLKNFFNRKGMMIAVLGPDGVGKTTICEGLKERLKNFHFKEIHQYHGRFGFFPELSQIYKFFSSNKISAHPTQESFFNKFRAYLHLFYYGLEAFLSWPWLILGKSRGKLFIFDRYFYDYLATSIHRQIPLWLFFIFSKFLPRPDLTFILYARPEEIQKRKKEWPIEELEKQLKAFQSPRLLKLSNCRVINNEKPLKVSLEKIEEEILKFLKI